MIFFDRLVSVTSNPSATSRDAHIDTLRGLACLFLVFFHVVGDTPEVGLVLPRTHWLHALNDAVSYVRMPLFGLIAGYVYALRPYKGDTGRFFKSKVQRLLLPVLTVGTLFALIQARVPGAHPDIAPRWMLHIIPVGHFWFLQSLFLVFMVVMALEQLGALATRRGIFATGIVSAALYTSWAAPIYLGLDGAVYLLPFFLGGLACRRFEMRPTLWRHAAAALLVAAALAVALNPAISAADRSNTASLLLGLSAAFLLVQSHLQGRFLAWLGTYSFAIFLLHVFFTAASRMALRRLGVTDTYVLLVAGMLMGTAGPMVAALVIRRYWLLDALLMGGPWALTPARQPAFQQSGIR